MHTKDILIIEDSVAAAKLLEDFFKKLDFSFNKE